MASREAALRRRYAEPHRAYHGQAHIDAMLSGLRAAGAAVTRPAVVELAIWYHDAIYDPAATDNEARSAALLREELAGLVAEQAVDAAVQMVEATARHQLPPAMDGALLRADAALFLDLDMAVLGASPGEYDAYEAGIAAEYVPVHGAAAYRRGRRAFLHDALGRERLFLTERCHAALDAAARANIRRAADALG